MASLWDSLLASGLFGAQAQPAQSQMQIPDQSQYGLNPQSSLMGADTMQIAGSNDLDNLRRILANDKGNGVKPISPPMSDQQILENLRKILRENS